MKKNHKEYLSSIGITGALLPKASEVVKFYTDYFSLPVEDIFVSEFVNKDGSRVFENLWVFSAQSCGEAKNFLKEDDFDSDKISKSIIWYKIKKTDFDVIGGKSNENSRMVLEFGMSNGRNAELKASKENCKQLSAIFKKYILENSQ